MFHIQDHTKNFEFIIGYFLKRLEMYSQLCYMVFNTFQQSLKMFVHSVYLSVRPHHTLTVVNILQMCFNLYLLFISDIEWTVLKMPCTVLSVRLQRHTKIFWCILEGGKLKFGKFIVTYLYCTKYNEFKYFIQLHKSVFHMQDHTKDFW